MAPAPVILLDNTTGSRAWIMPELGFNCYRFAAVAGGRPVEVLWAADDFETGQARPSGSGIPILFPFPGRLRGTQFTWQGTSYRVPPGDAWGNAIHGFVLKAPWKVIAQTSCQVRGRFRASRALPDWRSLWPADFVLEVTYALQGSALAMEIVIENPDDRPLPWALGTHPYFRIPCAEHGSAEACRIRVPMHQQWELVKMLPTGRRLDLPADRDLSQGRDLAGVQWDNVLTGVIGPAPWETVLHDPHAGVSIVQSCDVAFRHCVVYTPPHRQAVCLEPYSCVPGWIGQAYAPPEGEVALERVLNVLAPGSATRLQIIIRVA